MPSYLTSIVLEWSADPLSDSTPTWTTIPNTDIRGIEWWAGIDREGNDPEPGGMTVTLKNRARRYEPLFSSNTIDTQQRFRLTLNGTQEGVWYSETFDLDYPTGQDFSWVTITCGDGQTILALDDLPSLDPPEAEAYDDVVNFDGPWGYWPLDEPEGTKATAKVRVRFRGKGKNRRKIKRRHGTVYTTREEAGGEAGTSGVYKNLPGLGRPGLIVGDTATAVTFTAANQQYVHIVTDDDSFVSRNRLTLECWVKPTTTATQVFIAGQNNSAGGTTGPIFQLILNNAGPTFQAQVIAADTAYPVTSTSTPTAGAITHLVATYDGSSVRLYVDGVLEATAAASGALDVPSENILYIGRRTAGSYADSVMQKVAVYEYALSAERILAHYQAGAERGSEQEDAADRVSTMGLSNLWSVVVQTPNPDVLPITWHGQSRTEEIAEAVQAMGPQSMLWFNGDGDAVFFGYQWQTMNTNYNSVQWTFTDDGTGKPYQDIQLEYDFETFNEVLASHESGESVTVEDTTESGKRGRRVNSEYTDVLLVEHHDVEGLAAGVLDYYKEPAKRPVSLTIDGSHCLAQILDLDIGHLIKVTKSGETGAATARACHIIAKRKSIDTSRHLLCTYTLSRGFDPTDGFWKLGYDGFGDLNETTVLA